MVVLIGGSSHVGKTMIAHKLIAKHGWECISLDYLKEAFMKSQLGSPGDRSDYEMRYWLSTVRGTSLLRAATSPQSGQKASRSQS